MALGISVDTLLNGIPRFERTYGFAGTRDVQVGWIVPPMTPQELQEWEAFEQADGPLLLHDRIEYATAMVAMTVASAFGGAKDIRLQDFMMNWRGIVPAEQQDPEQIMAFIQGIAKAKERRGKQPRKLPEKDGKGSGSRGASS